MKCASECQAVIYFFHYAAFKTTDNNCDAQNNLNQEQNNICTLAAELNWSGKRDK